MKRSSPRAPETKLCARCIENFCETTRGTSTMRLQGKVSIITGAGRGIGHATALKFGREGAIVIVCDLEQPTIDQAVAAVKAAGADAQGFMVDVTNRSSIQA